MWRAAAVGPHARLGDLAGSSDHARRSVASTSGGSVPTCGSAARDVGHELADVLQRLADLEAEALVHRAVAHAETERKRPPDSSWITAAVCA
jgi:hypothetical protein